MRNGARSWLLATLSPRTIARISVDLGGGVWIASAAVLWNSVALSNRDGPLWYVALAALTLPLGFGAFALVKEFLQRLVITVHSSSPRRVAVQLVDVRGVS
jgi:hypothetical protein